jgi:hypothetical protein
MGMKSSHPLIFRCFILVVLGVFSTGCFQVDRVVRVKPDGSGSITQTVIIPHAVLKQLAEGLKLSIDGQVVPGTDPKPKIKSAADPDEDKLREAAKRMGEGVTFVSAKKTSTAVGEGFVATFAFTDINKVRIDQNPSDAMPDSSSPGLTIEANPNPDPEYITFELTRDRPSRLVVHMPQVKSVAKRKKASQADATPPEMAEAMMADMFKDMRFTLVVEADGKLVKTDAQHVSGTRVTLLDMDFNKLLADPAKVKALAKASPATFEEIKPFLKGIDGMKFETKATVTLAFQ